MKQWIDRLTNSIRKYNNKSNYLSNLMLAYEKKLLAVDFINYNSNKLNNPEIFANNYVNMSEIKAIGFDLDYTLINYTDNLPIYIYDKAKEKLINDYSFPKQLNDCNFDKEFAIRGLNIDNRHGILCKISYLQKVSLSSIHRGKKHLSDLNEIDRIYGKHRHIPHDDLINMRPLYDLYSIAEACLIADCVDLYDLNKFDNKIDMPIMIDIIRESVRQVHATGILHNEISSNLSKYIRPSNDLVKLCDHISNLHNKKLFLCTNSSHSYTDKALNYLIGKDWKDLFDIVICSAEKPDFYSRNKSFSIYNQIDKTVEYKPDLDKLVKGQIYINGSVDTFTKLTGLKAKDVLYIGDNLSADLKEARRWHGWYTGCIIRELDREVELQYNEKFQWLHHFRHTTREYLQELQSIINNDKPDDLVNYHTYIQTIESELKAINSEMSAEFNKRFGSIFRTDGHPSLFAFAIRRYVDLYTSDVTNLLGYNLTTHKFYPKHAIHMEHDPKTEKPLRDFLLQ